MSDIPPPGRERDKLITEWLGWEHNRFQGYWKVPGRPETWADVVFDRELPHWSTSDADALQLTNVELPARGYTTRTQVEPAERAQEEDLIGAYYFGATKTCKGWDYYAFADSYADAVSAVCCQIAMSAEGEADER